MDRLRILVTNDDGIDSNGLHALIDILRPFGDITAIAPASPQSGMGAAVSLGREICYTPLVREQGLTVGKLTGTPVTCVKFALMNFFTDRMPDLLVSGINHGSNTSASVIYSGTLGAAAEGALHDIVSVGVSVDNHSQEADLSAVRKILPSLLRSIIDCPPKPGIYLNINFPDLPAERIKGCTMASQGYGIWTKEFIPLPEDRQPSDGSRLFTMTGNFEDGQENLPTADHRLVSKGYVTIVPHYFDFTDYDEMKRLTEMWDL